MFQRCLCVIVLHLQLSAPSSVCATTLPDQQSLCMIPTRCTDDLASSFIIVPAFPFLVLLDPSFSKVGEKSGSKFKRPMAVQSKISRIGPFPCSRLPSVRNRARQETHASEALSCIRSLVHPALAFPSQAWRINCQISTHRKATRCTDHIPRSRIVACFLFC